MSNRLTAAAQTERDAGKMPPNRPVQPRTVRELQYDYSEAVQSVLRAAERWAGQHPETGNLAPVTAAYACRLIGALDAYRAAKVALDDAR